MSPVSGSWYSKDFAVSVRDEDLGSGIDPDACQYNIVALKEDGTEHSSGWIKRVCNAAGNISVGPEKRCRFEGKKACWVFIRSQDRAGNQHRPDKEKGSVAYYHIDWTKPSVEKVFVGNSQEEQTYPIQIKEGVEYEFKVKITDNIKITGCSLYINNQNQGTMSPLIPGCSKECIYTRKFTPQAPGSYKIFAGCRDATRNSGQGETVEARTNLAPKISSCRVSPTQGDLQTNFQFFAEASDPDNDNLSFVWNFGDGKTSNEQSPGHNYLQIGTYAPNVNVSDGKGGQSSCSSAWVTVVKE